MDYSTANNWSWGSSAVPLGYWGRHGGINSLHLHLLLLLGLSYKATCVLLPQENWGTELKKYLRERERDGFITPNHLGDHFLNRLKLSIRLKMTTEGC